MTSDSVSALLNAPYGHTSTLLDNGYYRLTLYDTPNGTVTHEAQTFAEAVFAALAKATALK